MQVLAMFLKRWHSFKRDWRMWLITLLPSLFIFSLLVLGFQREYTPSGMDMEVSGGLLRNYGVNETDKKVFNRAEQSTVSGLLGDLSALTAHGSRNKTLNATFMGEQLSSMENPNLVSVFNELLTFSESDEEEDAELAEIKGLLRSVLHEDLQIDGPFDLLTFSMKVMAA